MKPIAWIAGVGFALIAGSALAQTGGSMSGPPPSTPASSGSMSAPAGSMAAPSGSMSQQGGMSSGSMAAPAGSISHPGMQAGTMKKAPAKSKTSAQPANAMSGGSMSGPSH